MKIVRITFLTVYSLILVYLLIINIKLYHTPTFEQNHGQTYNLDLFHQLNHLEYKLHNGASLEMQSIYPEGFVFLTSLYGLSWCSFLEGVSINDPLYEKGVKEIIWTLREINSPNGKIPFEKNLPLPYGAFYTGWKNYLLGSFLKIKRDSLSTVDFQKSCNAIAHALNYSETPYLESYPQACWPADMTLCIASLALHDRIFTPRYQELINKWITDIEKVTDKYDLIPHSADAGTGFPLESARGSSQSLILNFLVEIDSTFASKKFNIYDSLFLDYRFGLPGIREYPTGTVGFGDIDSGPVLLGIGGAGSIVGQRTMARFGKGQVAIGIRSSIEAFGMATTIDMKKQYIFGLLPIADAFIA